MNILNDLAKGFNDLMSFTQTNDLSAAVVVLVCIGSCWVISDLVG